jgi:hypothetical protein
MKIMQNHTMLVTNPLPHVLQSAKSHDNNNNLIGNEEFALRDHKN